MSRCLQFFLPNYTGVPDMIRPVSDGRMTVSANLWGAMCIVMSWGIAVTTAGCNLPGTTCRFCRWRVSYRVR